MISLISLIKEANLPAVPGRGAVATTPQVDRVDADLGNIREKLADCLDIDPTSIQVKKSEKASIQDYANMQMTGDILIICPEVRRIGAEEVARLLNGFRFLEDIRINGNSGRDLSAIVFGGTRGGQMPGLGDSAGGDIIITSKVTEFRLLPFLASQGINTANCEDAMEDYWSHIGGRVISDEDILRNQRALAAALRPRLGMRQMGALPGGGMRRLHR